MEPENAIPENVTVRLEPTTRDAVNVFHMGRFEGYRDAMLDLLPIAGAILVVCLSLLIIRHWE